MKKIYRLLLCALSILPLNQLLNSMEEVSGFENAGLFFVNESDTSVDITKPKIGKVSAKSTGRSDQAPKEIEFYRYGKWKQLVAWTYTINVEQELLKKDITRIPEDKDIVVKLKMEPGIFRSTWAWEVSLISKKEIAESLTAIPSLNNPWNVFQGIKAKKGQESTFDYVWDLNKRDPMALARYVLDLGTEASKEDIEKRYDYLVHNLWNKSNDFHRDVREIITRARDILLGERGNFTDIIDKTFGSYRRARVDQGKSLLCRLLNDNKSIPVEACLNIHRNLTEDGIAHLQNIVDLMWYFYNIALDKNQRFTEGTFVIEDPNFIIYNSLLNYVKCIVDSIDPHSQLTGTTEDPEYKVAPNQYAYPRASTHFVIEQRRHNIRHYGIDIHGQDLRVLELPIPNKRHILFGKVGEGNKIFIKPESYGLSTRDVPWHAGELIAARARKWSNLFGDYYPKLLEYYLGTDDASYYRKERIPQEFIKRCKEILKVEYPINYGELKSKIDELSKMAVESEKKKERHNELIKQYLFYELSTKGMQYLYKLVNNRDEIKLGLGLGELSQHKDLFDKEQEKKLEQYLEQLEKQYDHLDMRYGREVIITHKELLNRCQQ